MTVFVRCPTHKILHLLDPGTFLCMTVRYVRAQNSVPLQLQYRWHSASKYWSQHSTHKSHSNIGRVKWFHPFFVPTCFNWCAEHTCRCYFSFTFLLLFCNILWGSDHSTFIIPAILMICTMFSHKRIQIHQFSNATNWDYSFNSDWYDTFFLKQN